MTRLTLRLLGSLQVICDGSSVTFAYDKVAALLAYLAVESGRPHSREALAELLWPDRPSATSRHSLSQALTALRRAVDLQSSLTLNRETIQFNSDDDYSLDVAEFNRLIDASDRHPHPRQEACAECAARLEQAASLYLGAFLTQFSIGDSAAFEEWALVRRETLHRRGMQALAQLVGYHEAQGDFERAITFARRQLELESWDEAAHRRLMRLLAVSGQRSAALAQYDRCREILTAELGVEPEAETEALYEQIKAGELSGAATESYPSPPRVSTLRHNLPAQSTPFIGREIEIAKLTTLFADPACRLITLVGPGGIGKTRLAIQTAAEHSERFAHGVWLVSLAPLAAPESLLPAIADTLKLVSYGQEDLKSSLLHFLRERKLLLALDNFEHLLDAAALLAEIVESAPGVKILVTSRERLNLRGEWILDMEGLSVPKDDEPEDLEAHSAVKLFLQGARRARASFELGSDNRPFVARICRLVSGMPLGLELAAAWLPVLSCEEIVREIERNLDFLSTSLRDLPERHRSLRAVFDQSWQLLSESERAVFRRLSAFSGGCTREAAEAVAGASLPGLLGLVSKSLLRRSAGRFEIHELLRQYGAARLHELPDDEAQTRDRHSEYYCALLAAQEATLKGRGQREALDAIGAELDNIRAAWLWAIERRNLGALAKSVDAMWLWYAARNQHDAEAIFGEAARWIERQSGADATVESAANPTRDLALGKFLCALGSTYFRRGSYAQARQLIEQSLALFRDIQAQWEIAWALNMRAATVHLLGGYSEERQFLEESIALGRATGDRWITAYSLNDLGLVLHLLGDDGEAERLSRESLVFFRELDDPRGLAFAFNNLGIIAVQRGAHAEAEALYRESLALRRANDDRWGVAVSLTQLGAVAHAQGHYAEAQADFLEALRTTKDMRVWPVVLDTLIELAALTASTGDIARAHTMLTLIRQHPARTLEVQNKAGRLLGALGLPPESSAVEARAPAEAVEALVDTLLKADLPQTL